MMLNALKRVSLSGQAAAAIRKGIEEATWKEFLPGERRLCEMFQVSRPTIHAALRMLVAEGLISVRRSHRSRILWRGRGPGAAQTRLVAIVTSDPVSVSSIIFNRSLSEMRIHLAEHGFGTTTFVCKARTQLAQHRKLEAFLRQNGVLCCLLFSVNRELQQWFAAHSVPALVLGSCHASVRLPSLDMDNRSVCRHGAGVLLRKGHRQIALIAPEGRYAGTLASEQGFLEAFERSNVDGDGAVIIRHNGTARDLNAKLDSVFKSSRAPTAILIAGVQCVLHVIFYLLKHRLAVPDQVSILSRDHDSFFADTVPPISHYYFKDQMFNKRLLRLMLQLVSHGHLPTKPNLIYPRLFAGATVKNLA